VTYAFYVAFGALCAMLAYNPDKPEKAIVLLLGEIFGSLIYIAYRLDNKKEQ
jgi:hypothetical protein